MLLKARFTINVEKLNAIVDQYNQTNGVVKFLTQPVFTSNSEVVGEQNEIMSVSYTHLTLPTILRV